MTGALKHWRDSYVVNARYDFLCPCKHIILKLLHAICACLCEVAIATELEKSWDWKVMAISWILHAVHCNEKSNRTKHEDKHYPCGTICCYVGIRIHGSSYTYNPRNPGSGRVTCEQDNGESITDTNWTKDGKAVVPRSTRQSYNQLELNRDNIAGHWGSSEIWRPVPLSIVEHWLMIVKHVIHHLLFNMDSSIKKHKQNVCNC